MLALDGPIAPGTGQRISGSGAPREFGIWVELWRVRQGARAAESVASVPAAPDGTFVVDPVDVGAGDAFYATLSRSWQFDRPADLEGWTGSSDGTLQVSGGVLRVTVGDGNGDGFRDPSTTLFFTYNPAYYRVIEIRLRNPAPANAASRHLGVHWGAGYPNDVHRHLVAMPEAMSEFETLLIPMGLGHTRLVPGPVTVDLDGLWNQGTTNNALRLDPWCGIPRDDGSLDGLEFEIDTIRIREDMRWDFHRTGDAMGIGRATNLSGFAIVDGALSFAADGAPTIEFDVDTGIVDPAHFAHFAIGTDNDRVGVSDNAIGMRCRDILGTPLAVDFLLSAIGRQDEFFAIDGSGMGWSAAGRIAAAGIEFDIPRDATPGDQLRIDYLGFIPAQPYGPSDAIVAQPANNPPVAVATSSAVNGEVELDALGIASVELDASPSHDGDNGTQGLSYSWEQVLGPPARIASPAGVITAVEFDAAGDYAFRVTVDDGQAVDALASAEVEVTVLEAAPTDPPEPPEPTALFVRGEVDGNGVALEVRDGLAILRGLFRSSRTGAIDFACPDAADVNDDGRIDLADGIAIFRHHRGADLPPPAPYPECGADPTDDALGVCTYDETQCASTATAGDRQQEKRFRRMLKKKRDQMREGKRRDTRRRPCREKRTRR